MKSQRMDPVPYLDAAATLDKPVTMSLFILNRDLSKARLVEVVWEDNAPSRVIDSWFFTGDDLKAVNSFETPEKVHPQALRQT